MEPSKGLMIYFPKIRLSVSINFTPSVITFAERISMPQKEWFRDWFNSPYYHKLYFERDEQEAKVFIENLVKHIHPLAGSRMLDVACGRGRHSRMLASLGFNVTGIDISPKNIDYAQQHIPTGLSEETADPEFFVHDIRLPFWGNYFDYAFNFFTSFGYFRTKREHDGAVRNIVRSLKPGGIFVIDYLNVHYAETHLVHNEEKKINRTTYSILRWQDEKHFFKKISVTDPLLTQPLSFTEEVAKFSLGDFTAMLAFQGMLVKEVFGDYNLNPYDINETPRLIIVAARQNVTSSV